MELALLQKQKWLQQEAWLTTYKTAVHAAGPGGVAVQTSTHSHFPPTCLEDDPLATYRLTLETFKLTTADT